MGWMSIPRNDGTYGSRDVNSTDEYRSASPEVANAIRAHRDGRGPEVPEDTVRQVLIANGYYSVEQLLATYR